MLGAALGQRAAEAPQRPFVIDGDGTLTYAEAVAWAGQAAAAWAGSGAPRIYLHQGDSARLVVALVAANLAGKEVCVLNRDLSPSEAEALAKELGEGAGVGQGPPTSTLAVPGGRGPLPDAVLPGDGGRVVLTTGTTGRPKPVLHSWPRLFAQVRAAPPQRWLLCYPLNHFAGIAVVAHVVASGGTLVIPGTRRLADLAAAAVSHHVGAISGTPTFWRMFTGPLLDAGGGTAFAGHITLGGEPATQDILDRLAVTFPNATISHVYATTELGSCFSVRDGLAGFPLEYLHRRVGNVELRIADGELEVRAPHRMMGYADERPGDEAEWIATGDQVEVIDDRVVFRGRRCEIVNVGGVKVFPQKVEEVILAVPGVQAVRVQGRSNPVTGQIVVARLELVPGEDAPRVLAAVRRACRGALNRYEVPRDIRIEPSLPRVNEKIAREVST